MSNLKLKIFGSDDPDMSYISWIPAPLTVENTSGEPISVHLRSKSAPDAVTKLNFWENSGSIPQDTITILVDGNSETTVYVAGKFQHGEKHHGASAEGKDVMVEARAQSNLEGGVLCSLDLMVRVRRNANELSDKAKMDFLKALAKLNGIKVDRDETPGAGKGIYCTDFVDMHVAGATKNLHGDAQFLPWHRLYILDLERQLQKVNPVVTLPYWKFDEKAPNLFSEDFMGRMLEIPRNYNKPGGEFDQGGANTPLAVFSPSNPLSKWKIKDAAGIPRTARFNQKSEAANGLTDGTPDGDFSLLDEQETLALGGGQSNPENAVLQEGSRRSTDWKGFARMESTPHGAAHVSFNGYINFVPVAPQDPLFFLLHSNVDRLWAKWQLLFKRDIADQVKSYPYQNTGDASPWKIIDSTQWPWDGTKSHPDDLYPPGTRKENFTESKMAENFPDNVPKVNNTIDPYAYHEKSHYLGFSYDDVPYNYNYNPQTLV